MRNAFEQRVAAALPSGYTYETQVLRYTLPEASYTPDWYDGASHTIIEAKGLWRAEDRRKMRLIREQYPALRIILVFQNPRRTISRRSKTSYEEYARRIGLEVVRLDDLPLLLG